MSIPLPPLRFTVPLVILLFGCLLGGLWTYQAIERGYQRVEQSQLETSRLQAAVVVPQVEAFFRSGEAERAKTFLNRLNADRELRKVILIDSQGEVLYSAQFADEGSSRAPEPLVDLAAEARRRAQNVVRLQDDGDTIRSAFPVWLTRSHEEAGRPSGVLLQERDLRFLKAQARQRAWRGLLATLAILLLLCVITWGVLHRIVTRRLNRFIGVTERFAGGDARARSELSGHDELARIGRAFNEMADKIEAAQQELREREQLFGQLIEYGTDIIGLTDTEGTVLFVSPSVKGILGLQPEALLGRCLFDLIHPDDRDNASEAIRKAVAADAGPQSIEVRVRHSAGHWVVIDAVGNSSPELMGRGEVVVNARDITEWKELHDRLRQSEKMQAVGQLAGGIAHDFNNLLTAIMGYSSLLSGACERDSMAADYLAEIRKAAERGRDLVRQLLAFSRKQILNPRNVDLNFVIQELESLLHRTLGEQVKLILILTGTPPIVKADRIQLEQVLLNLAVNAQQAMPQGGRLEIETRVLPSEDLPAAAGHEAADEYVLLRVRDSGIGIADDIRERIFDPFFTSKAKGEGTGLGLATVHGIISQSHGTIWVDSVPGKGATFWICLPRSREGFEEALPSTADKPALATASFAGRAMVVEDEPAVRALVATTLGQMGFEVEAVGLVASATKALADVGDEPPVLAVCDVVLPDGSGKEIAEWIADKLPKTRVLLMSGYAEEMVGDIDSDCRYGFIAKPFTPEQFAEAVRNLLAEVPGLGDRRA